MCLGIPGKVVETYREHDVLMGKVDFSGVFKRVCLEHVPDVQPGDHVIGVFVPEQGTTFYADDKIIGTIAGDDFARAFFAIWLDPRTSAPGLRNQLLANGAAQ